MTAYLNRVSTAVPPNDVHGAFVAFAHELLQDPREQALFDRLAQRSGIDHRWSVLSPAPSDDGFGAIDVGQVYRRGAFAGTGRRMQTFERFAPDLAQQAVEGLLSPAERAQVTHVIVTCCTGLSAPGLDLQLISRCGLNPSVERTVIGFMGCYAAVSALKLSRHIVRSEPQAKVLIVSLELCTLHLQETAQLDQVLSFLVFGDGCAAALVSGEPHGFGLDGFRAVLAPQAADQITWNIRDQGFDMVLSGQVPRSVGSALHDNAAAILGNAGVGEIDLWAVHPGGRSVLDAVETALALPQPALEASRAVLRDYGNMSSATILFVLDRLLAGARRGDRGCGMAFGPGLTAETFTFHAAA